MHMKHSKNIIRADSLNKASANAKRTRGKLHPRVRIFSAFNREDEVRMNNSSKSGWNHVTKGYCCLSSRIESRSALEDTAAKKTSRKQERYQ